MKPLFWLLVALDLAALGMLALFALAAAAPSHTPPALAVAVPVAIPGLILAGAIAGFVRAKSVVGRLVALLAVASPLLFALGSAGVARWTLQRYLSPDGTVWRFGSEPLRQIEAAIGRDDAAEVTRLARGVDLNQRGMDDQTVLLLALRHREKTPGSLAVVKALLAAGARPDVAGDALPLVEAIHLSRRMGLEPVRLLLQKGADPNARGPWGEPALFAACGQGMKTDALRALLDAGADVNAADRDGETALLVATNTRNWKVVRLLLQRGADWRRVRTPDGGTLRDRWEADARSVGTGDGLAEVLRFARTGR